MPGGPSPAAGAGAAERMICCTLREDLLVEVSKLAEVVLTNA
jgi:hypothetical protein